VSPRSVRLWSIVRRWTSLVATAFLLLLCLTGLPLIFHQEIDTMAGVARDRLTACGDRMVGDPRGIGVRLTARLSLSPPDLCVAQPLSALERRVAHQGYARHACDGDRRRDIHSRRQSKKREAMTCPGGP
jgi:hypothetical protein